MSASAITKQDEKMKTLGLQKVTVNTDQVVSYSRALGAASEHNPILVLLHGYPQSSYMWRHLIPLLPSEAPIFAADLPGYGASAPIEKNDKLSVGNTVLAALQTEFKRASATSSGSIPVVLIGHDRGARVAHHLAASPPAQFVVKGVCLVDIVPTTIQWEASVSPVEVVGYFHWPLLANVDLATRLITAFGPEKWCEEMCFRWAGRNSSGIASFRADDALSVYKQFFSQEHTLVASNKDYEAGASVDVDVEKEWRKQGKKIATEVLVLYSESFIGSRYDFPKVWGEWVQEGKLKTHALGNEVGHFGVEEAPEATASALREWLKAL